MSISKQQILDAYQFRSACRYYDPAKKIPKEDMDFLLELARLSPSSVGSEPWKFIVLQNMDIRNKIKPFTWGIRQPMEEISHIVVALAKKGARFDSPFFKDIMTRRGLTEEQQEKALKQYELFQREHMRVLDDERYLFDWCAKQTYIVMGNIMTGAAMLGIDTCPIEGFNYESVNTILAEAGLFDPAEYGVANMITFGYRGKEIAPKSRKATEDVIEWIE